MKKIITVLILSASLMFAQRGGHGGGFHGYGGYHGPVVHPPIVVRPPVVVGPRVGVVIGPGYYGYPYYGWNPYWYPGFGYVYAPEPKTCQKEKLKDSKGVKHEVLACKQSDGSVKVYSPDGSVQ